ncbi:oxidoreductase [Bordetella sp. LUAb4]|uniref:oxidoreductase n=1 Tax=Bordetella sp. LUAb4 TaxID=2843195 RepID=UPI001E5CEA03|nr:oxidoreductase [Bordetella sp. LUAb4]
MANETGYTGLLAPGEGNSQLGALLFLVRSVLLKEVRTIDLVRVVSVTNSGGLEPVGYVDVQPLVNQVDGAGNAVPHGTVYHLPYFRLQGGDNAVILDPRVGDIGLAAYACRDISSVKATKGQANPGSARSFDMADGIYFGGVLNGVPKQYIRFGADGIDIVSPTSIRLSAPDIALQASKGITLSADADVKVSAASIELDGSLTQGAGPRGGAATMQGPLQVNADVNASGISLTGHTHAENGKGGQTNPPTS